MFGEGFEHMDSFEQLQDGQYEAKIKTAEIKSGNYGEQLILTVEVIGHAGAKPDTIYISDSPKSGFGNMSHEQAIEMWNRNMTKIFKNFEIAEGDFDCSHWVGKTGVITVQAQKKKPQYKEIVPYPQNPRKAIPPKEVIEGELVDEEEPEIF